MGILGSSGNECYVCSKDIEEGEAVEEDGKKFCCEKCEQKYEDEEAEKEEVCKFC